MEFKSEELVEREIEIGKLLIQNISLKEIGEKTGTGKRILAAHIKNMMKKLKAENIAELIKLVKAMRL